jgi:hypothetical protein
LSDEVVLAFPAIVAPVRHVRSTLVLGGVQSIKAAGLLEAYEAVSPPEVRNTILSSVAGMWLPVDVAVAHYLACDRMELSSESASKLGRGTFERTKGLLLGTATGLAKGVGVNPWTLFPHFQRFWLRGLDGGGVRVVRLGPKEARVDVVDCPLFESDYFRAACTGLTMSLCELVCRKCYAHDVGARDDRWKLTLRVQWA